MQRIKRTNYGISTTVQATEEQAEFVDLTRRLFLSADGKKWLDHIKRKYAFGTANIYADPVETHSMQCKQDIIYHIESTLNKEVL